LVKADEMNLICLEISVPGDVQPPRGRERQIQRKRLLLHGICVNGVTVCEQVLVP
jgi:hypothetical protein